ncbi:MAG: hypothetical protein LBV31_00815 [Prevotellaceae bacterium]|nr:hypothetical protein [Prevotellaceae bacterium]
MRCGDLVKNVSTTLSDHADGSLSVVETKNNEGLRVYRPQSMLSYL